MRRTAIASDPKRRVRPAVALSVLALVASLVVGAPSGAADGDVTIDTFAQDLPPQDASALLATAGGVWFQTYDGTGGGSSTLGRIAGDGTVQTAATPGSGYAYQPPVETTDGNVWIATDPGGAAIKAPDGAALAGVDPTAFDLSATPSNGFPLDGWQTAADGSGMFWAQTNTAGMGILAIGQALHGSLRSVQTKIGPASDQDDLAVNNPLVLGPDGRMWLLGGDGTTSGVRVTALDGSGIAVDVAPANQDLGGLTLTEGGGDMWALTIHHPLSRLAALGLDPSGSTRTVQTSLHAECHLPGLQPVVDATANLWFSGSDAGCGNGGGLSLVKLATGPGTHATVATGLTALDDLAVSDLVVQPEGVYVAGLDGSGGLAFALADSGGSVTTVSTDLQPFVAPGQVTYPLVADPTGGVWTQAMEGSGNLVLVHADAAGTTTTRTGLAPIARSFLIGPDGNPWVQAMNTAGELVIVRATPSGVQAYPTLLDPTRVVWAGVEGASGDLWFRALDSASGDLIVVRVQIDSVGPTTTTTMSTSTVPTTPTTVPAEPLAPSFTG